MEYEFKEQSPWLSKEPKYKIGQRVEVTLKTVHEKTKIEFTNIVFGYIASIVASADTGDYIFTYGIMQELPAPYNYGKTYLGTLTEKEIKTV